MSIKVLCNGLKSATQALNFIKTKNRKNRREIKNRFKSIGHRFSWDLLNPQREKMKCVLSLYIITNHQEYPNYQINTILSNQSHKRLEACKPITYFKMSPYQIRVSSMWCRIYSAINKTRTLRKFANHKNRK